MAIAPAADAGKFRVDVLRSPDGSVASVAVDLDVHGLLARRRDLEQAVLVSGVPTRALFPEEERVRDAGRALFGALLGVGEVAGRYRAAAAVSAERGEGLRVVLRIADPALAALPWEAMYDDAVGGYVCRREQLVRHIGVPVAAPPLAVDGPLRILGIVSSPRGLATLNVAKEQDQLATALARLTADGLAELDWAPSATWADLQDQLQDGPWHVVHFTGHSDFDTRLGEGLLALEGEDGWAHLVGASRFTDLLGTARPMPRLVVLNSCSGGAGSAADLFAGTATALVRTGFGAVVAMQYEITDAAAVAFSRGFYGAIARGRGIDEAASSGRTAILGLSGRTLEWVTPVLYLRGSESRLFAVSPPRSGSPSGLAAPRAGHAVPSAPAVSPDPAPSARAAARGPVRQARGRAAHNGGAVAVAFSPDGTLVASAGKDHAVHVFDATSLEGTGRFHSEADDEVHAIAFAPDGTLASGWSDGSVRLLRAIGTGSLHWTHQRQADARAVARLACAPGAGGTTVIAAGVDRGTVAVWRDPAGGWPALVPRPVTWNIGERGLSALALSPDGTLLAASGPSGFRGERVGLWSTVDRAAQLSHWTLGGPFSRYGAPAGVIEGLAFSPDGLLLASGDGGGAIWLWDVRAMRGRELAGPAVAGLGRVRAVAFSPADAALLAAGGDNGIALWDTDSGQLVRGLAGHDGPVRSIAFSPDGRSLASAGDDGTVRLWE